MQDDTLRRLRILLETEYGVSVRDVEELNGATSAHVFVVTLADGTRRIAKTSLWYGFTDDPKAVLEKVYAVAEKLGAEGVALQTAQRKVGGDFVAELDGLPLVLLRYVDGVAFTGRPEEFAAAGDALGRFHAAGARILASEPGEAADIRARVPLEKPYEESRAVYVQIKERIMLPVQGEPPEVAVARDALPQMEELMQFVDVSFKRPLTETILHGDFGAPNGLYEDDGRFAGFIDIDQLGVGPSITDIAISLGSLATAYMKTHTLEEFHAMAVVFLRAYHLVHPLPADEYGLLLAANQRWDVMRILRILRRHFEGSGAFENPLKKMATRFIPRLAKAPDIFAFVKEPLTRSIIER